MTSKRARNTIRFLNSWAGIILLVLSLFYLQMPYFCATTPFTSWSIPRGRWIFIVFLGVCLLLTCENIKDLFRKEKLLWGAVGWNLVLIISSLVQGKEINYILKDNIPACLLAVLILSVYSKADIKRILFVLFMYNLVINTLNNASMLFFANTGIPIPYGEPNIEYYFFGHINGGITCALNSLLFGCMYAHQYQRSWDLVNWVNLAYSMLTAVIVKCDVQIVLYALAAVGLILCYVYRRWKGLGRLLRWINLGTIMVVNVIVEIMVIPLGKTGWMEMLHMDPRVHGRRELWDSVLGDIRQHPILGQGFSSWFGAEINGSVHNFWHQHSVYLMVAYETGIVGIVVFVYLFVIAIKELLKVAELEVRFLTGLLVGGFFLAVTIDCCERSEIFLLLGACYYIAQRLPHRTKKMDASAKVVE